jgi:hypothetical protein
MLLNPIMTDTEQLNIRISKALIYDVEFISQHLKVNRNDWIKLNLAKLIMEAKEVIISEYEERYVNCFLTDEEFRKLTGFNPTQGMIELREKELRQKEQNEELMKANFLKMAKKLKKASKKIYFDKYLTGVVKKIEKKTSQSS